MSEIYVPLVLNDQESSSTPQRIVIDPLTRIEGHLRIEAQIEAGFVQDAWSSSTMFRGIEKILNGRDPREAWVFAQRICGVCTTVHALASVRAVENALGIEVPENARLLRALIEAAQFVQDHVIHFYHLHALDWVDIVDSLSADPVATSALSRSISSWPNSSPEHFSAVQQRVQGLVNSGQLGIFANGYWGHPAYNLTPEANLLAVSHYLEALDWQREFIKIHAILGGKNPHPQTYLVGGMAIPIDNNSSAAINGHKITQLHNLVSLGVDFVNQVYLPDLQLVAASYLDWTSLGQGPGNYLSYGDFPLNGVRQNWLPGGVIFGKDISNPPLNLDPGQITEYVTHSWYSYVDGDKPALHPSSGETNPNYNGPEPPYEYLNIESKYSWLKAPRYHDFPMEVGPLARMLVAYASGHAKVVQLVNETLAELGVGSQALFSTIGRIAARGIETKLFVEEMGAWIDKLRDNMHSGKTTTHNGALWEPTTWPEHAEGAGFTEAPRGGLGHWVRIENGAIAHYQAVVPTTWNGSPRDANRVRGPFEEALIGTPIADPEKPLEILRTIHSFDPCMACSVHLVNARRQPSGIKVQVLH
jgi:[NiFe] hydrogenase large subunit/hydrogenase large subunit